MIPHVFSKNSKLFCSSPVYLIPRLPLSSCGVFFVANLPLCRRRPFQKTYSPQKPRIRASSGTNHADIAQYLLLFRICQHLSINTTFFLTLPWSFCYVLSIISILGDPLNKFETVLFFGCLLDSSATPFQLQSLFCCRRPFQIISVLSPRPPWICALTLHSACKSPLSPCYQHLSTITTVLSGNTTSFSSLSFSSLKLLFLYLYCSETGNTYTCWRWGTVYRRTWRWGTGYGTASDHPSSVVVVESTSFHHPVDVESISKISNRYPLTHHLGFGTLLPHRIVAVITLRRGLN